MKRLLPVLLFMCALCTPANRGYAAPPAFDLCGEWEHVGNGHPGILVIEEQQGNSFSGRFLFPQYGYDQPLIDGLFDGNAVSFTRDIAAKQEYTGVLIVSADGSMSMKGTFTQLGSGSYEWTATLGKRIDEDAELAIEPPDDPEEFALAKTPSIIFQNYPRVWEDAERAVLPALPKSAIFKEPPQSSTAFTIEKPHVITRVTTFHWYGGNGANPPGSIQIVKVDGGYEKTWAAQGVKEATKSVVVYWVVEPNVTLTPGTYYVNAIPKATWSFNQRSNLRGIAKVEGYQGSGDDSGDEPKTVVREYPITPGVPASGSVDAELVLHKYSFRAEAGQSLTLSVEAAKSLGVRADLMSPEKKRVGRILARSTLKTSAKRFRAKSTGVYEIHVWVKNKVLRTGAYRVGVDVR